MVCEDLLSESVLLLRLSLLRFNTSSGIGFCFCTLTISRATFITSASVGKLAVDSTPSSEIEEKKEDRRKEKKEEKKGKMLMKNERKK
jgi:hypothetical protein